MNCKNCKSELNENDNFCNECGAKIIKERITIKGLISSVLVALGWDSNFFVTLRYLFYKPQIILKEYINGTRKKYANPFTFFVLNLAISLFVFNQYSKEFYELSVPQKQETTIDKDVRFNDKNTKKIFERFGFKNRQEFSKKIIEIQKKYYNLSNFIFLPLYTLIAFLVFRKPHNYGEHLVINTYILSVVTFFSILLFAFSILTKINLFYYTSFFTFVYYSYVYKKLNELTSGKLILKILKFIGILLLFMIIASIITFIFLIINNKIK